MRRSSYLARLPLVASAFAAFLAPTPCQSATAIRANDFLNSIGVCTHMSQGEDDTTHVAAFLTYTGIRTIRDDGSTSATTLQKFIAVHASCGAKVSLLPVNGNIAASISEYETLAAAGALLAAEGPNEPNNWPVTYQGQTSSGTTSMPIAQFQKDLYAAVTADAKLAGIPVFHSSEAGGSEPDNCGLQFLIIPGGAGTKMPDGTHFADYANCHNYVCAHLTSVIDNNAWGAEDPVLNGQWDGMYVEYHHSWWGSGFDGYTLSQLPAVPRVTTETGWTTSGNNSISEEQQARLFLNLYLSAYKQGWSYTFVYMLKDSPAQGAWGFFHTDYTPKLSGAYMHNFTTILADASSSFAPGSLDYSIPSEPATMHEMLMQKSDGTFDLAVWSERASGSDNVTVSLGSTYSVVKVYDPTIDTLPAQALSNVYAVNLTLSDHPEIIEIGGSLSARLAPPHSHMQYGQAWGNGTMVRLYSLKGDLVQTAHGALATSQSSVAAGTYLYRISDRTRVIGSGKLVVPEGGLCRSQLLYAR